ncbi:hypothetical protein [Desulfohalovibrio reitneri]|uniref:hypothetical protein n=1 Tax=Desulfohalovibrio reitneri TaxID=1307759 RepID=UPI0004A6ABA1|nr:hypothetical protein [Desulfohalovibrio reitneri]
MTKTIIYLFAAAVLAGIVSLFMGGGDDGQDPGAARESMAVASAGQNGGETSNLLVLFDASVYHPGEKERFAGLVERFEKFFLGLPERSRVVVWTVDQALCNARPACRAELGFDRSIGGAEQHRDKLSSLFAELEPDLMSAWDTQHSREKWTDPVSCLITSLHEAANRLHSGDVPPGRSNTLVVVSDMLEACDEWGAEDRTVNLERGLERARARLDWGEIDAYMAKLDVFDKIIIMRVPSHRVTDPGELARLKDFWERVLANAGADLNSVVYRTSFPQTHFN